MKAMRIQWRRAERSNWALPFFAGLLAGAAFVYLNGDQLLTENGLLSWMGLERLRYFKINESAFFWYVLGKRLGLMWLVAVLATTFAGIVTTYLFVLWMGICGGVIGGAAIWRYGMKGFLLLAGGMMPHFLCYGPALFLLADWCMQIYMRLHYPVIDYTEIQGGGAKKSRLAGKILLVHGVVIIGVLLESYVNPSLMVELLKIF